MCVWEPPHNTRLRGGNPQEGHLEVVRDLLSRGANSRAATTNGVIALSLATGGNGHKKLLRAAKLAKR